jgi:hypothetical protein
VLISGFTVIRNARILGYPVVPSIKSILPIVDEFIVAVGQSDDDTRAVIELIGDPKIKIIDTRWDTPRSATGGTILSDKTNEALAHCQGEWCFYLQADEVVHEHDLPAILKSCQDYRNDALVEALLFKYIHLYGSYSTIAVSRSWYRQEVRIVKRAVGARSVGDAQSFLIDGRKAFVKWSGGTIYHYGHVKPPQQMGEKERHMTRWYQGREVAAPAAFQFRQQYGLRTFAGTHPAVMREVIAAQDWSFEPKLDLRQWNKRDYRSAVSAFLETVFRYRFGERKKFRLLK